MEKSNISMVKATNLGPKVPAGSISKQSLIEVAFSFLSNCEVN